MKKLSITLLALGLAVSLFAKDKQTTDYRAVDKKDAQILQDGKTKDYCPVCGMTLSNYYKTNHAATVNGEVHQYCSMHCLLDEADQNGTTPTNIKVVDNESLKFIDVKDAFYVVGSKMPGTMSKISQYAFSTKKGAQEFSKKHGGKIVSFDVARKQMQESLEKDRKMVAKNQAKAMKKGEKLYAKVCKKTDQKFANVAQAKAYIAEHNLCGKLKGKKRQAVAIYLTRR